MRKYRNTIFYVVLIGTLLAVMYWVIRMGTQLESPELLRGEKTNNGAWKDFITTLCDSLQHPLAILLAQIVTIIIAARIMGWICIKIKQPVVIGEMLAGIILGPSLLGIYF